nr:unnamed protein product [Callosobruchus analis]
MILNPEEIASSFNKFFINIADELTSNIPHSTDSSIPRQKNIHSFYLQPSDCIEVENIISDLKVASSPVKDNISTRSMKLDVFYDSMSNERSCTNIKCLTTLADLRVAKVEIAASKRFLEEKERSVQNLNTIISLLKDPANEVNKCKQIANSAPKQQPPSTSSVAFAPNAVPSTGAPLADHASPLESTLRSNHKTSNIDTSISTAEQRSIAGTDQPRMYLSRIK